jgi:fibronectin type 3 domain-containing protein
MKRKLFTIAGVLVVLLTFSLVLAGCGDSESGDPTSAGTETPGGENPGGENPGGENPGGENPGGENPGGENPGGENPDPDSPPNTPTGVTATALTSTSIRISWNAVPGAVSYKIYAPDTPGSSSNFDLIGTSTTNSYTDSFPGASETWYYKVSAVNSIGESAQSISVSAKTPNPLNAPTNVVAAHADYASRLNTSRTSIKITWNAVFGAVSYNVYEYVTYLGGYWDKVGSASGPEWTHTGLQPATSHSYIVKAVDSGGTESAASSSSMGRTAP